MTVTKEECERALDYLWATRRKTRYIVDNKAHNNLLQLIKEHFELVEDYARLCYDNHLLSIAIDELKSNPPLKFEELETRIPYHFYNWRCSDCCFILKIDEENRKLETIDCFGIKETLNFDDYQFYRHEVKEND